MGMHAVEIALCNFEFWSFPRPSIHSAILMMLSRSHAIMSVNNSSLTASWVAKL